jgi:hypothetical protein
MKKNKVYYIRLSELRSLVKEIMFSNRIRNALSPAESDREQIGFLKHGDQEEDEISSHLKDGEIEDDSYEDLTVKRKENTVLVRPDPFTRMIYRNN